MNTHKDRKVELLSPAGSPAAFYGAIHAGADAVYLAGNEYGARAYADNFSEEELLVCIRYAHLWKRKVYLTVNTLVKEPGIDGLQAFLEPLVQAGLDGVIIQDFGVLGKIRRLFPTLEMHASTQMNITGPYGACLLADMGVKRVVPARELSLSEVKKIKEASGLEIECFIHGAICYCYSGRCLFSSVLGGRSGNRGRCAQPCRLSYQVDGQNKNTGNKKAGAELYPLSLKDMCTLEVLPSLIEAGIDSFKIEGRMKKPEYTAGVTAIYRRNIDRYYEGKFDLSKIKEDRKLLEKLYIRSGISDGYYFRRNGKEMVTLYDPAYSGSDEALLDQIRKEYIEKKPYIPVRMEAEFMTGKPAILKMISAEDPSLEYTAVGEIVQAAQNAPVTAEGLEKQLSKLGNTSFAPALNNSGVKEILIKTDGKSFLPVKSVNELRRAATEGLEEVMIHA